MLEKVSSIFYLNTYIYIYIFILGDDILEEKIENKKVVFIYVLEWEDFLAVQLSYLKKKVRKSKLIF